MITETEDLRIIRLNPSNQSVEYLCDDFEKLVDNTGITVGCVTRSYLLRQDRTEEWSFK